MKKILLLTLFITFSLLSFAQPAPIKKAAKAVYRLTTYNQQGDILTTTYAIALSSQGECAAQWTPFVGAARATLEDETGKIYPVETILGANELYNVCRFKAEGPLTALSLASKPVTSGNKVWVSLPNKFGKTEETSINKVEIFNEKYNYYTLSNPFAIPSSFSGLALTNAAGQAIGLVQVSAQGEASAIDLSFIRTLQITDALAINDPTLLTTHIRLALPQNKEQALTLLVLLGQRSDSLTRVNYIHDFIRQFPSEIDGYQALAEEELRAKHYGEAHSQLQYAINKCDKKDEAHAAWAKLIYQKNIWFPQDVADEFTISNGLQAIRTAYKLQPLPAYKHQEAQLLFLQNQYAEALDIFLSLTKTNIRSGEIFFEASACKEALKAPTEEVICLLDSAVNVHLATEPQLAAPYVLSRADAWNRAANYRKAVSDYNLYDSINGGRPISPEFYYVRSKCEVQIRQFQQALTDLNRALLLDSRNSLLWAEKAAMHLRFKQYEDAIRASEFCLKFDEQNTDAMIVAGIALDALSKDKARSKSEASENKQKSIAYFDRAKALGDNRGDAYRK